MDRKQREERRRQEDIALQRGLLWVAGAIVLEALLMAVNRYYINYYLTDWEIGLAGMINGLLNFLRFAAPVATGAALGCALWRLKSGKRFGLALVVSLAMGAVSVCVHVIVKFQGPGLSMLFWLVVAWAVLALVYYIYQREFFVAAAACGMSVLALWFVRYDRNGLAESILVLAAIAVVTAAVVWMKKSGGTLPGKQAIRFLPEDTNYAVALATCAASLAAPIAALLLGGTAAYYLIFVMVAWLFALFVYYTVKLM